MFHIDTLGVVQSPYKEKFAIPRQPGLAPHVTGKILLQGSCNNPDYVRGLEQFSHLWVVFIFHQHLQKNHKPLIRPPRLGGNKKIGVFASRSTFRPNPLGMSVVKLEDIITQNKQTSVVISGLDLLDGTPVVDIKPYIPYSDSVPEASAGYAQFEPSPLTVHIPDELAKQIAQLTSEYANLKQIIIEVLQQNPAPAYQADSEKVFGMTLFDLNICWRLKNAEIHLVSIEKV